MQRFIISFNANGNKNAMETALRQLLEEQFLLEDLSIKTTLPGIGSPQVMRAACDGEVLGLFYTGDDMEARARERAAECGLHGEVTWEEVSIN